MPKSKSSEAANAPSLARGPRLDPIAEAAQPPENTRPAKAPTMTVEPTAGDSITIQPPAAGADKPEEPVHD